ncbi:uncharacterized protein EV154DRAFT_480507 [Mucor mucedo]|uniref:uncharacterized protein n=1 Tax=Mucor mucedo TaxID=29922 RepID=UPI00221F632E|nr:uncharacterized protein EV154DRAFT_480507 [Mucor mucedo]KAI7892335.1 hypothetical protein EV154DRAFT_480507 [Mucor mucedo]
MYAKECSGLVLLRERPSIINSSLARLVAAFFAALFSALWSIFEDEVDGSGGGGKEAGDKQTDADRRGDGEGEGEGRGDGEGEGWGDWTESVPGTEKLSFYDGAAEANDKRGLKIWHVSHNLACHLALSKKEVEFNMYIKDP